MKRSIRIRIWSIITVIVSGLFAKLCSGMGEYPTTFQFWCLFMSIATGIGGLIGICVSFE